jgi:hypothetical protein
MRLLKFAVGPTIELVFRELTYASRILRISALNELTRTSVSKIRRSDTMSVLVVRVDAFATCILKISALNELTVTSLSMKSISETIRELIVMEEADPF